MFAVISCITTEHDYRYVVLAALIATFGSLLTMRLFSRVRRSGGARRCYWLFLSALLGGGTIWTTHFVAMLGFKLPIQHSYDLTLTIASLAIAIGLTGFGFFVSSLSQSGPEVEAGGAILGIGIATMHYTGMAALRLEGTLHWNMRMVIASVILGVVFGAIATNRVARPVTRFCKYGGPIAMLLAICTMHFTGMAAMSIVPRAGIAVPPQAVSDSVLIAGVVAVMVLLMATGASTYMIDQLSSREAVDRYRHLAMHDPLTGLPNRAQLSTRLSEVLQSEIGGNTRIAILTFDLDRFKDVNDVHGHAAGDAVLKALAERISSALRDTDFMARLGGDEFVAVRQNIYSRGDAASFAQEILSICQTPVEWNSHLLQVGASVGAAIYPDDAQAADVLLGRSDLAMYRAKGLGRNRVCIFEETMDELHRTRSALAMDLKNAVRNGELELYYQPQNDTVSRDLLGFEVLLRWNHPQRGMISPTEFIPLAEETGAIIEIGAWVIREACREAASWSMHYSVAVNVSAAQIARADLPRIVQEALVGSGLSPARLELEITESGIISDQQHALHVIRQLKALGVRIAMDDYGTGYSSLATLQNFPFDKIKIDRTFVDNVTSNPQAAAIVKATIILGTSLNIPVLAEGVETEEHINFLAAEGCAELQGYYFGKPMPRANLQAMMPEGKLPCDAMPEANDAAEDAALPRSRSNPGTRSAAA